MSLFFVIQYYTDELQAGRIDRIYTGLVEGQIDADGMVDEPIGVDGEQHPSSRCVRRRGPQMTIV